MEKYFVPHIFIQLAKRVLAGKAIMTRRSTSDKEYFFQDWFSNIISKSYTLTPLGRNSHPDFVISKSEQIEGAELKSLENLRPAPYDLSRNPCRTDIDFNSTVPCGLIPYQGELMRTFYYFALYENIKGSKLKTRAIALAVVDGYYLNKDLNLVKRHKNTSVGGFGSYGDGFIRTRKMYRFPNPLTEPEFRYKTVLVVEDSDLDKRFKELKFFKKVTKKGKSGRTFAFYAYQLA